MQTSVVLPARTIKEIHKIGMQFGFRNEEEFVREAVSEKILQLKKRIFFSLTDQVRLKAESKGITTDKILENFERFRDANYSCS